LNNSDSLQLTALDIATAVIDAGLTPLGAHTAERFATYFNLLQRWNAKLNLTAIRTAEGILRRHFLECIFCAQTLPVGITTLLDFGSGAGFPGVPIALCRPEIHVTMAESQGKKASFLREVVRSLGIVAEVYAGRVEEMAAGRIFDAVAMRAVDNMREAVEAASSRVRDNGWLVLLASRDSITLPDGFGAEEKAVPGTNSGVLLLARRVDVPRETLP
jgi:16S rRNA (guanine527-N7)-methyltransferase